jgi:16S rRNA (guanine527-N7)-methyltransferase
MSQPLEIEDTPPEAELIFGDQLPIADKYAQLLARDGDLLGLIGPRELPK